MIDYIVKQEWRQHAEKMATGEKFNETTIKECGEGQVAGTIGELAFGRYLIDSGLGFDYVAQDSFDHDFEVMGSRVDVKTKKSVGKPKPNYMIRVPLSQRDQDTDTYVFTYLSDDRIWLLGWEDKQDFWRGRKSFVARQGDVIDGFVEKVDCRYMFVEDLNNFESFEMSFVAV